MKDMKDMKEHFRDGFPAHPPGMHRHAARRGDGGFTVTLTRGELEYDIRYALWKRGQMAGAGGESVYLYEIEEDENGWLARQLSSAAERLGRRLSWTLAGDREEDVTDTVSGIPESWTFRFRHGFRPDGTPAGIADMMHSFVVYTVLAEWFRTGDRDASAAYAAAAEDTLSRFRTKAPARRRRPPYLHRNAVMLEDGADDGAEGEEEYGAEYLT